MKPARDYQRSIRNVLAATALLGTVAAQAMPAQPDLTVQPNNEFGFRTMQGVVQQTPEQNVFLSPVSAAMAFSMLLNGAGTHTLISLENAMNLSGLDLGQINQANLNLISGLNRKADAQHSDAEQPFVLKTANSIWSDEQSGFKFSDQFASQIQKYYQGTAKVVDFSKQAGVDEINNWASTSTDGKIPEVVSADGLRGISYLLMNATYFKADWAVPFTARNTVKNAPFNLIDGSQSKVDMMSENAYLKYFADDSIQAVALPYKGGATMYVMLPNEGKTLASLEIAPNGIFSAEYLNQLKTAMNTQEAAYLNVQLPKVALKYSVNLNAVLQALGMSDAFSDTADFAPIGSKGMKLEQVKQDTFLNIDEKGTEAAAVTVIGVGAEFMPPRPMLFKVDRPFAFAILDDASGSVLFLGSITNPAAL